MNKKITAALLLTGMLISVSACGNQAPGEAHYYTSKETFRKISTETTKVTKSVIYDDFYIEMELTSESGAKIRYKYDSDLLSYVQQGGTFYLVGTDATKGYVHVIVQDVSVGSYEEAKSANSNNSITEITLESGRKAFYYTASNDEGNFHLVIDAKDIVPSGKGVVHCYIGSKASWTYGEDKIANVLDKGFTVAK